MLRGDIRVGSIYKKLMNIKLRLDSQLYIFTFTYIHTHRRGCLTLKVAI